MSGGAVGAFAVCKVAIPYKRPMPLALPPPNWDPTRKPWSSN